MTNEMTVDILITDICNGMMPVLSQEQLSRLKNVLYIRMSDLNISVKCYDLVTTIQENDAMKLEYFQTTLRLRNLTEGTIAQYTRTTKDLRNFVGKNFVDIETIHIEKYLASRTLSNNWSPTMVRNTIHYLNSFFKFMMEKKFITENPMVGIRPVKLEKKRKEYFSSTELEQLRLAAKDNARASALIELLYASGIRVGELIQLKWYNLDMRRLCFVVHGKGSKEREVYFSERAGFYLLRYMEERMKRENRTRDDIMSRAVIASQKLSPKTHDYEGIKAGAIRNELERLAKKAKVVTKHNPHKFRRTFATDAINHGVPMEQVQKILGHESPETTQEYAILKNSTIENSYRTHCE